jgi:hypothetical protein
MATVWLRRREWQDGDVPDVCMKCGRYAPDRVRKTLTWVPRWVFLLILVNLLVLLVVAFAVRQTRQARLPLCDGHKNDWGWRNAFGLWSFLALAAVALVGLGLVLALAEEADLEDALFGWVGFLLGGLLFWFIAFVIVNSGAVRAMEFTMRSIRLTNVSAEFRDAVEDEFEGGGGSRYGSGPDLDRSVRERWGERKPRKATEEPGRIRKEPAENDPPRRSDRYRPE